MRRLYSLLLFIGLPVVFTRLFLKGNKNPMYRQRWKERLGFVEKIEKRPKHLFWIHAVSVGEVEATAPLVRKLFAEYSDLVIIMTTTTPTGAETVERRYKNKYKNKIIHHYIPYDLINFQQRFIEQIQPDILIIIETEVWPNLIHLCQEKNIPVLLANARMSESSYNGYQKISILSQATFAGINSIAAQTDQDAKRIIALGAASENVTITGSLKFDQQLPADLTKIALALKKRIGITRPVWIAASTHEGEEEIILAAHQEILKTIPDSLLILVPRHPERFDNVYQLCIKKSFTTVRRSLNQDIQGHIYLVDTMGDLLICYGASDIALVAGSLTPIGGHNLLEPASLSLPILMGPYTFKIEKIFQTFLDTNAVERVSDQYDIATKIIELFQNKTKRKELGESAKNLVIKNQGAAELHMQIIHKLLS